MEPFGPGPGSRGHGEVQLPGSLGKDMGSTPGPGEASSSKPPGSAG